MWRELLKARDRLWRLLGISYTVNIDIAAAWIIRRLWMGWERGIITGDCREPGSLALSFSLSLCDGRTGSELCGWEESRTPRRTLIMQSLSFLPAPWPWHWPIAVTRGELGTFSLSFSSSTSFSLSHINTRRYTHFYTNPTKLGLHPRLWLITGTALMTAPQTWAHYGTEDSIQLFRPAAGTSTSWRFSLAFAQTACFYFHLSYLVVNFHYYLLLVHICGRPKVFHVWRGVTTIAISAFILS